ncbi:MAG: 2-oxoacid:acceptor oxidoreductase family protein [Victivallaceae bacterium]|nr:2-oxoacid:acceptor oxidoreductase family protein [Victivallaceae bacterium]
MSTEKIIHGRSAGFFPEFSRRPGNNHTNMHYCPGCGHGILHKLIAEAIEDLEIKDRTVLISPVGCSVFAYYYFDCFGISVPHGRAPAVGTGLVRSNPDDIVISYQGDGDLGAIGFNEFIQTANRGENMAVFFVNNAIYGMTGGQMAPTTLPGQKTVTCPLGRSVTNEGYPLKVSEMVSALDSPVYVERVALSSGKNILRARAAVRKALNNVIEKKGFSMVEFLSGCPVNLKMNASQVNEFIDERMCKYFPLGVFKDIADTRDSIKRSSGVYAPEAVRKVLYPQYSSSSVSRDFQNPSPFFAKERRLKVAGFGGQGVLSFGHMLATMGKLRNFNVSYLPVYGPEMRGGTASCSVVVSRKKIASPVVDRDCNLLVVLNDESLEKFLPELKPTGVLIFDSSNVHVSRLRRTQIAYCVNASDLARELGDLRYANSILMGALAKLMDDFFLQETDKADFERVVEEAIRECFADKSEVIRKNINAFYLGKQAASRWNAPSDGQ